MTGQFTFTFHFHALEKEMATHSSVLAGESQGWGSLVGCRLWGRTESDMTEATAAAAEAAVCGILAPWPGMEPALPALEGEVLATGSPGKSLIHF